MSALKYKVYGLRPDRRFIGVWLDRDLAIAIARDLTRKKRTTEEARSYFLYDGSEVWEETYSHEGIEGEFLGEKLIYTRERGGKEAEIV